MSNTVKFHFVLHSNELYALLKLYKHLQFLKRNIKVVQILNIEEINLLKNYKHVIKNNSQYK